MGPSTPERKSQGGAHQITAGSKSMVDTLKMDATVSRSETCEFFIRRFGQRQWEQLVKLAGIDQERSLALFDVDLRCKTFFQQACQNVYIILSIERTHVQILFCDKRRMGNGYRLNDVFESKIERKAGCHHVIGLSIVRRHPWTDVVPP
jgi:hypothetical protein